MNKMNQLYEGKAKRVYETEDPNLLIVFITMYSKMKII